MMETTLDLHMYMLNYVSTVFSLNKTLSTTQEIKNPAARGFKMDYTYSIM